MWWFDDLWSLPPITAFNPKPKLTAIAVEDFPKEVLPTPTGDLIEVYKTCLLLQDYCQRKKLGIVSAIQFGIPWMLFVCAWFPGYRPEDWRYYLNYSYKPLSDEKQDAMVRFVNVEERDSRYFIVKRHKQVEYQLTELVIDTQPKLIERVGTDELGIYVQNEYELLTGRYPHVEGEEHWFRNGALIPK